MTRAVLPPRCIALLLAALPAALYAASCDKHFPTQDECPTIYVEEHLAEDGAPDPCCLSRNPCCPNPLWLRRVTNMDGDKVPDPCCLTVDCPGWDPWANPDGGTDASASGDAELDGDTEPDGDAGADQ
jgi:hypothetical protein